MNASPLIQVGELQSLLAGPETGRPVVLDVRFRLGESTGRLDFERAHVPSASYVDMDTELATIRPDGVGGRHPMPTVETFAAAMRSAGVTMSRPVVAYDDWASLPASRLWWMLRHFGFLDVRVLDGGIAAWIAGGHPTESGSHTPGVGDFSPSSPGFGRLLDATAAATYAGRHVLLDARNADRFRGENETIDAVAGRIPGAISAPALDTVDPSGRFLSADQLAARFQHLGHAATRTVGTYCGSGVQATHLALALSIAGVTNHTDVYIGSWSDWITDPDRPIATR
ncbi:MAG: sulfurtransferase [Phycicoccus sp.]|nr:sulfurtransferase [Phycicoccus sp.]NMM34312.1 sulfurtransferase [Phycicoccus sp.]